MNRYAIFVDAGYLLAAGGWACVDVYRRAELVVEYPDLVEMIQKHASDQLPQNELLRLYWYDASPNRVPMADHQLIASLSDTKIRMGHLTARGDQKGVDAMLLSDLTSLSGGRKIEDAIVLAGDGDFVEAISRSQSEGVRVHLWGVQTPQSTVSPDLRREADRFLFLTPDELRPFFKRAPTFDPPISDPSVTDSPELPSGVERVPGTASIDEASRQPVWASIDLDEAVASGRRFARQWAQMSSHGEIAAVLSARPQVPGHIHYRLLRATLEDAGIQWGTHISYDAAEAMRNGFWETLVQIAGEMAK